MQENNLVSWTGRCEGGCDQCTSLIFARRTMENPKSPQDSLFTAPLWHLGIICIQFKHVACILVVINVRLTEEVGWILFMPHF